MFEQRTSNCVGCEHCADCSEERQRECQAGFENRADAVKEDLMLFRG